MMSNLILIFLVMFISDNVYAQQDCELTHRYGNKFNMKCDRSGGGIKNISNPDLWKAFDHPSALQQIDERRQRDRQYQLELYKAQTERMKIQGQMPQPAGTNTIMTNKQITSSDFEKWNAEAKRIKLEQQCEGSYTPDSSYLSHEVLSDICFIQKFYDRGYGILLKECTNSPKYCAIERAAREKEVLAGQQRRKASLETTKQQRLQAYNECIDDPVSYSREKRIAYCKEAHSIE